MAKHFSQNDWNQLLDGEVHLVDLDVLQFKGGVANFRAMVHYQAEKRHGSVKTKKLDATSLTVQGVDCEPLILGRRPPLFVPAPLASVPTPQALPPVPSPSSFGPVPTDEELDAMIDDMTEEEELALLGPCTCGQRPQCLPSCARYN